MIPAAWWREKESYMPVARGPQLKDAPRSPTTAAQTENGASFVADVMYTKDAAKKKKSFHLSFQWNKSYAENAREVM